MSMRIELCGPTAGAGRILSGALTSVLVPDAELQRNAISWCFRSTVWTCVTARAGRRCVFRVRAPAGACTPTPNIVLRHGRSSSTTAEAPSAYLGTIAARPLLHHPCLQQSSYPASHAMPAGAKGGLCFLHRCYLQYTLYTDSHRRGMRWDSGAPVGDAPVHRTAGHLQAGTCIPSRGSRASL